MTDQEKLQLYSDAGHMALGYLISKENDLSSRPVYFLALALHKAGSTSDYVKDIVGRNEKRLDIPQMVNK